MMSFNHFQLLRRVDASGIQQLLNTTQNTEPKAVLAQVGVMTVLSLLTLIVFNILRPNRRHIYEPKVKYHASDKAPPSTSRSFCGWISPLMHNHESQLLAKIGLDAVAFLRFLDLMKVLLGLTALVTCGALIPIDLLYTLQTNPPQHDILTSMTIRDVRGIRLYAHIGAVYLITIILLVLVHHHWRDIYALRDRWFRSDEYQHALHARSLIVMHIPERRRSEQGILRIFEGMQLPYTVTSAYMGQDVGALPDLVKLYDETLQALEKSVTKSYSQQKWKETKRPSVKVGGWCGLGGRRQDAIKYYTRKLKEVHAMIMQLRIQMESTQHPENFGFATLDSIYSAHAAAHYLRGEHPKGLTIKLAPNHKDVIWKNIGLSKRKRRFKQMTGFILLSIFCFLSLVPLFPIASLANLSAIASSGYIPFLSKWASASPISYILASGIVPPAIAAIFGHILPGVMRWLSKFMGAPTYSHLDRVVIARYFSFLFVSQLIFFTVIGVLFHSILNIVIATQEQGAGLKGVFDNLSKLPRELASTYVDQSSFWLKWFPLRGFLLIFDLSQVSKMLWLSWSRRAFSTTPRVLQESSKPPLFPYATQYSGLLFMGVTGILFAPLAPLVSLAAAVVFWLSTWVYKYQLVFKFVTRVESGGRAWNVVINRLIFGCIFMQIIMVFTIGLQAEFKSLQFLATVPPVLVTVLFKHYINKKFANDFQYFLPSQHYQSRAMVHSDRMDKGKLDDRYKNPALLSELPGPLIDSRVASALRGIYNQDLTRSRSVRFRGVSNTRRDVMHDETDETVVEGITFKTLQPHELEYDPDEYRRDREVVERDFDPDETRPSTETQYTSKSYPKRKNSGKTTLVSQNEVVTPRHSDVHVQEEERRELMSEYDRGPVAATHLSSPPPTYISGSTWRDVQTPPAPPKDAQSGRPFRSSRG